MSLDLPFWTSIARAARSWGLAALAIAIAAVAAADWAATNFDVARADADDDIVTGSVPQRPKERTTCVIRSVLSDEPIVLRN